MKNKQENKASGERERSEHTPGLWIAEEALKQLAYRIKQAGASKGLALVSKAADAYLIAAAPDMRKQLEDDLEYFEANRDDVYCRVRSRRIKKLLDKAEGRNV